MGIATGIGTVLVLYGFDKFKDTINLTHKYKTLAFSGVLANKYNVLKTLILLDKSIYFTKQMTLAIETNLFESDKILERHVENMKNTKSQMTDKLNKFKQIT